MISNESLHLAYRGPDGIKMYRLVPMQLWFGNASGSHTPRWWLRSRDMADGEVKEFAVENFLGSEYPLPASSAQEDPQRSDNLSSFKDTTPPEYGEPVG